VKLKLLRNREEKPLNVKLYLDEDCKIPVETNPLNNEYVLPGEECEFTLWLRNEEKTMVDRLKVECDLPYVKVFGTPKILKDGEKAKVKVKAVFPESLEESPLPNFVVSGLRLLPVLKK
jgi:hypothetical protein